VAPQGHVQAVGDLGLAGAGLAADGDDQAAAGPGRGALRLDHARQELLGRPGVLRGDARAIAAPRRGEAVLAALAQPAGSRAQRDQAVEPRGQSGCPGGPAERVAGHPPPGPGRAATGGGPPGSAPPGAPDRSRTPA
jgi:hypothetical protein